MTKAAVKAKPRKKPVHWRRILKAMGACGGSLEWARTQRGTWGEAWKACPNTGWLTWVISRTLGFEAECRAWNVADQASMELPYEAWKAERLRLIRVAFGCPRLRMPKRVRP